MTSNRLVDEVLVSFGIRSDPWTMEYKDAVDKVNRSLEMVRQEGFDEGFDEGEIEGNHCSHDEAFQDGYDNGLMEATLYTVLENYIHKSMRVNVLNIESVEQGDGTVLVTARTGLHSRRSFEFEIRELIDELS